jgi:glucoamylase
MTQFRGNQSAFGQPGIEPRWTHSNKDGIGTAYASSSRVWFTLWNGILTEAYFPTLDKPQMRDLQYLISDGKSFFHEEKRHLNPTVGRLWQHGLGYWVTSADPEGRYQIHKKIICDPHLPCVLQHTRLEAQLSDPLHLYVLCAPHLEVGGWENNA